MIHRVVFGSVERFIGVITEHFAGAFPLWLAPEQVVLLPVADRHQEACEKVKEVLDKAGFRVRIDTRSEKLGYKLREAQLQKIPYMLVVGDKEAEDGTVSVRRRGAGDQGTFTVDDFIALASKEVDEKTIW